MTIHTNTLIQGIGLALVSNVLFAVFYLYSGWLAPMTGTDVFVWRVMTMWLSIMICLVMTKQMRPVINELSQIAHNKKQLAWLLLSAPIMLSQMWLFMWAPLNEQGVEVAIGYFLFPLVMVLFGRMFFQEKLLGLKKWAVTFASVGVLIEIFNGGSLSWATFWVCGTFPIYYIMRRQLPLRPIGGLLVDSTLFLPLGILYFCYYNDAFSYIYDPIMTIKAFGLGAISLMAFMANLRAIKLLPVSLFGMLSYLEPLLLFILAITLLGEPLNLKSLVSYGLIAMGIACLIINGIKYKKE